MLIRIINGIFGYRPPDEGGKPGMTVEAKTRHDPPFEVDDALAARLVQDGIAVYEDEKPVATPPVAAADTSGDKAGMDTGEDENAVQALYGAEGAHLDHSQLMTMSFEQLKKLAADMGIATTGLRSKAALANAIAAEAVSGEAEELGEDEPEEAPEAEDEDEALEDEEEPPALEALGPVE